MGEPAWAAEARAAGWLSPEDAVLKAWRARNLNHGETCRWCGAARVRGSGTRSWWRNHDQPQPHWPYCRFYSGPVKHGFRNGRMGSFGYWIDCLCGKSYAEHDENGDKRECPDAALTFREAREPDLTAA